MMCDAYPRRIARFVRTRWTKLQRDPELAARTLRETALLESPAFEHLLSTAYRASLLEEVARPATFRLLLSDSDGVDPCAGAPSGLHRLLFDRPRSYSAHELRRLSPAAKCLRALIGVSHAARSGSFSIWGILQSRPRWLRGAGGGRLPRAAAACGALLVQVTGPERLTISWNDITLAQARGGQLLETSMDVFDSAPPP